MIDDTSVAGYSLCDAYHKLLERMYGNGTIIDAPAWNTTCRELTGVSMLVYGTSPLQYISKFGIHTPESLKSYCDEMLNGTLDWAVREGKEPYTYHDRLSNQWREALDILRDDPNSRRAVMTVRLPEDVTMDDQPCLTTVQLLIRNNALDMIVFFRSNDLWEATFMNAYALRKLQEKWAEELHIRAGEYLHTVGSLHVYSKDWDKLEAAVNRMREGNKYDCLYTAEEFWEAM